MSAKKTIFALTIGTAFELYGFFLDGSAALVFGKIFFPTRDPLVGTLAAFGTFAVGFISRPLGVLVFGHNGDRISRKQALTMTIGIIGVAHS